MLGNYRNKNPSVCWCSSVGGPVRREIHGRPVLECKLYAFQKFLRLNLQPVRAHYHPRVLASHSTLWNSESSPHLHYHLVIHWCPDYPLLLFRRLSPTSPQCLPRPNRVIDVGVRYGKEVEANTIDGKLTKTDESESLSRKLWRWEAAAAIPVMRGGAQHLHRV